MESIWLPIVQDGSASMRSMLPFQAETEVKLCTFILNASISVAVWLNGRASDYEL